MILWFSHSEIPRLNILILGLTAYSQPELVQHTGAQAAKSGIH